MTEKFITILQYFQKLHSITKTKLSHYSFHWQMALMIKKKKSKSSTLSLFISALTGWPYNDVQLRPFSFDHSIVWVNLCLKLNSRFTFKICSNFAKISTALEILHKLDYMYYGLLGLSNSFCNVGSAYRQAGKKSWFS